jgi:radical SAM superfamily enzyme YgiQ (UPF0313 family)
MTCQVVLISTYELGRQPFGLAAPAALLRAAGAEVTLHDLSVTPLDEHAVRRAQLVGFYVPMHTASRLTERVVARIRELNGHAHLCVYGLYAPLNERHFRNLGVDTVIGGECERRLVELYREVSANDRPPDGRQRIPVVSLEHQPFITPDREGLPSLENYAQLVLPSGERRVVGYTEASRGCRHRCRHCPIVPVYDGRFVAVPRPVVIDDVRQQVAAGARHITFGDPDFFNGPVHSLRLVHELYTEFPFLTYDVTIKVEHLRRHLPLLAELQATGCLLVTSAVESFDPDVLERFDKRHSPEDVEVVLAECRRVGLAFNPTFVAFTPWTTLGGYRDFLDRIVELDLVANVSPVQYGIRLLITAGSLLLELPDVEALVGDFDEMALCYPWKHADPAVDALWREIVEITARTDGLSRAEIFGAVSHAATRGAHGRRRPDPAPQLATIPFLTEPWYC